MQGERPMSSPASPSLPYRSEYWELRKPAARGRKGVVVAQAREAAEAGLALLEAGGNAIDAAVGTALALAVIEPWNSGLGGIGFAVLRPEPEGEPVVVDFGPRAPRGLDVRAFPLTGRMKEDLFSWPEVAGDVNIHGPLSFAVPASVAGYAYMHQRWGRLPWREVLAPALALARRGLPADWFTTLKIASAAKELRLYPESARIYLRDGLPPVPPYQGSPSFLPLGRLPETLERLAQAGAEDFYRGEIARAIIKDVEAMGGFLAAEDLAHLSVETRAPLLHECAGQRWWLASGLTAGKTLAAVLDTIGPPAPRGSRPDAAWYARLAAALLAAYRRRLESEGGGPGRAAETCTTHLTVCDAEGRIAAVTTTLLSSMGSRVVLPTTGILMNNGIMWFDPRPEHPNGIAPGKRPLTNMCPLIAQGSAGEIFAGGASGGRRILAAVAQTASFVLDFGMDVEEAAHWPRIDVSGPERIHADLRLGPEIIAALEAVAPVTRVEHGVFPINFACPNFLLLHPDGRREGVSDAGSPWSAALAEEVAAGGTAGA